MLKDIIEIENKKTYFKKKTNEKNIITIKGIL
jgi:hypothetical protein